MAGTPTILSGLTTSLTDKREQVVYEMATCLAHARWVSQGLYERAVEALGHVGITDVIVLMGTYTQPFQGGYRTLRNRFVPANKINGLKGLAQVLLYIWASARHSLSVEFNVERFSWHWIRSLRVSSNTARSR